MLGGMLIFSGVNASAFVTNQGTEIVTSDELSKLDLTNKKYKFKNCGEGLYYRYDDKYKALIIIEQKVPVDSENNSISVMLNSSDFKDKNDVRLLYIDGAIKFDSDFDSVVKNNTNRKDGTNMKVCINGYEKTKTNFVSKYGDGKCDLCFNNTPDEFYFIDHSQVENVVDYNGLLGKYDNLIDNVVGYKGCRVNNKILIEDTSNTEETKATDIVATSTVSTNTPSTNTPSNKVKEKYLVIDKEPTFELTGQSHVEELMSSGNLVVGEKQEIPKLDESLKSVYYANTKSNINTDNTNTSSSSDKNANTTTNQSGTSNNAQQPTGDNNGILTLITLGLGSLIGLSKFKNKSSKIK